MESLALVKAAEGVPSVAIVVVYVTICADGATVSVTCTAAVTPTLASSSVTIAVNSSTGTASRDAIAAAALGAEEPRGW